MNDVSMLEVSLRYPDGTRQQLTVDAATALIGSGSHCEIRLPSEDAAVEQLRISLDAAGIFGQVRSLERGVRLNGAPFVEGRLLPGNLLTIGRVELTVSAIETVVARGHTKERRNSGKSASYAVLALALPLGFYLLLSQRDSGDALPSEVKPPPLFAEASSTRCPETEHSAALAVATEERRRAETARERAPFSGQDAVNAVLAFRRSAACFVLADSGARAEGSRREADALERDVETEFHVHRVRLERALSTKSYEDARTEVRVLLSYIGRHGGAYKSWLLSLDRRIQLKFSGKK
ncbi:MAG TPA: FHA domain-containing protein [Polyangiaceae bacterium]